MLGRVGEVMPMIDFTIETRISRPVDEVFGYVTDPSKLATWQTNTVSAAQEGDGPVGLGTRIREVHRGPGGTEAESIVEVSEYEPNRTFALRVVEGTPIHARITFGPIGEGTHMRFRVHGELEGGMRLLQPLARRLLRRQFTADCARLKGALETGGGGR
jgi:uncharacterized protein YndB with AHSA1/START domain